VNYIQLTSYKQKTRKTTTCIKGVVAQYRDLMAKYLSPRRLDVLCSVIFLLVKVTNAKLNGKDVKSADQRLKTNKMSFWDGRKSAGGDQCNGNICPAIFNKLNEVKKDGEKFEERECKGTCSCGDLLDEFTCFDYKDTRNLGIMGNKGPVIPGFNDRQLTHVPDLDECKRICLNSDGLEVKSLEFSLGSASGRQYGWCSCSSKAPGDKGVSIVYEDGMTFCLRKCKPVSKPVEKPTAKGVYLGCFKERDDNKQPCLYYWCSSTSGPPLPRDIYEQQHNYQDNSRERCVTKCYEGGYKYAGLQFNRCFCGNSFGSYGSAKESDCNVPCPIGYNGIINWDAKVNRSKTIPPDWRYSWKDHASDKCGGWSEYHGDRVKNSVYWTRVNDPLYTPPMFFNSRVQGPPAASVAGRVRRSLGGLVAVLVFCYALVRCRF